MLWLTTFFYQKFHLPYRETSGKPPTYLAPIFLVTVLHFGYIQMELYTLFSANSI